MSRRNKEFDYERLCREWRWDIPEFFNIAVDCVDKHAADEGRRNRICLIWEDASGEARTFTYARMKELTDRLGNGLRALGIGKGDRVLLRLPNLPQFHVSFLAALKIGAVPIPSSVMFRESEIEYRLNDSNAVAAITTGQFVNEIDAVQDRCAALRHVVIVGKPFRDEHVGYDELMNRASPELRVEKTRAEDMAFICYTSGTTGEPKGVVHAHRWLIGNDPSVLLWDDLKPDDVVAHTGQMSWVFTFSNGFVFVWRHGGTTLIYDGQFDPGKWFALMEKNRVTNLISVPTAYRMMLAADGAERRYKINLRHCISAGEPLTPEMFHEWTERFGVSPHDGIGMTEFTVFLANMRGMELRPGSCGRPMPGHTCTLLDEHGNYVPDGKIGILAGRTGDPAMFIKYWNKPEQTRAMYHDQWFLTGDTCTRTQDGYYWFVGRSDDLIMSSGYRISPFEVETTVSSHPAVLECAAVASPHKVRGVIVKAFVVLKPGFSPSDKLAVEIQTHVKNTIAPYKYPRVVEFIKELPKTTSGKIMRKLLRDRELR